jgi:hypothetical protein
LYRKSVIIVASLLLAYFVFTSGAVYEATGSNVTDRMVVPYSLALSGERTGLAGLFTEDDQRVAEWVVNESDKDLPVVCDGNMALLLRSYDFFPRVEQITSFKGTFYSKPHYIVFSTWNIETGKMVVTATSAGMRGVDVLPEMDISEYVEVFGSGKSVVYEKM